MENKMTFFKFFITDDAVVDYSAVFENCKTDSDRGKLILSMVKYAKYGEEPTLPSKLYKDWLILKMGLKSSKKGFENGRKNTNLKQDSVENETDFKQDSNKTEKKMNQNSNQTPSDNQQVNTSLLTATPEATPSTDRIEENIKKEKSVKGKGYIDEEEEWGYIENNTHESAPLTPAPISSEAEDKIFKQIKEKVGTRDMVKYDYRFISQDTGIEEGVVKRVTERLIEKGLIKCSILEVESKTNGKFYPTPHWSLISKSLGDGVIKVKVPTQAQTLGTAAYEDSKYSQLYIQASKYEWNYKDGWKTNDFIDGNEDIITKINSVIRTGITWDTKKREEFWCNYDSKFYALLLYAIKQYSLKQSA